MAPSGTTTGATTIASGGGLADRYAAALYAYAEEQHALDTVVAEMEALGQLIDASADFRRLLESPLIDVNQATRAAARGAGTGRLRQAGARLRRRHRRQPPAAQPARHRRAPSPPWWRNAAASSPPHVASAHPLNDVQRQQLRARLIEAGYGNVNILEAVEPDLLGGLVVRIGARLYDTSLKSRLQRLQYAMKGAA